MTETAERKKFFGILSCVTHALYTYKAAAMNKDGCFEVNIICREQSGDDPHPIKLSAEDEDF